MTTFFSVIIPNYNGEETLRPCLQAVFASRYTNFELIVVDDCSEDRSVEIIREFPCKLIQFSQHSGASRARNAGAANSQGEILFFTDADCLLQPDTLAITKQMISSANDKTVFGGTYTSIPFDHSFFSLFQSIFIRHSETKHPSDADYIATHAMAIHVRVFQSNDGFANNFLPILEDVEFSHRLQRNGYSLVINPDIQVQHIFNFGLFASLKNALKKSRYWTFYSIKRGDLLRDSGTASLELKTNVASFFLIILMLLAFSISKNNYLLLAILTILVLNYAISRHLLIAMYRTGGMLFFIGATIYYLFIYPVAVGLGAILGVAAYLRNLISKRVPI